MKSIIVKLVLVVICIFIVVAILLYGLNNITKSIIELTPEFKEKIRMDSVSALDKMCQDINDNFEIPVYYINYVRIEEEFFKGMYYIDFEIKDDGYSEKMLLKTKDKGEIVKSCELLKLYLVWNYEEGKLKNPTNIKIKNFLISSHARTGDCAIKGYFQYSIDFIDKNIKDYIEFSNIDFCTDSVKCNLNEPGLINCLEFREQVMQVELFITKGTTTKKIPTEVIVSEDKVEIIYDKTVSFEKMILNVYSLDNGVEKFYNLPILPSTES